MEEDTVAPHERPMIAGASVNFVLYSANTRKNRTNVSFGLVDPPILVLSILDVGQKALR